MVRSRQGTPAARRRTGLRRCRDRRRPVSEQRVRGRRGYRPPARRSLVRSGIRGTRDGRTHLGNERCPQTRLRQLRRRRRPGCCRTDRDGCHAQREGRGGRRHRGRRSRRGSGRPRHTARTRPRCDRHRYRQSLERRLPAFPRRDPRVLRREPRTADPGRSPPHPSQPLSTASVATRRWPTASASRESAWGLSFQLPRLPCVARDLQAGATERSPTLQQSRDSLTAAR